MDAIRPSNNHFARLWRVYTFPFRPNIQQLQTLSARQIEGQMRAGYARLIIVNLALVQGIVLLLAWFNHAPLSLLVPQSVGMAIVLTCVALLLAGRVMLASVLYVLGIFGTIIGIGLAGPPEVSVRSLLVFMLFAIIIPVTGLLLPRWSIWLMTALCIGTISFALYLRPLAPSLQLGTGADLRPLIIGFMATIFASLAVLTWLIVRGTSSNIQSVVRAYRQEQELAALKDQFIIYINHELHTPMMGLYGNIELLQKLGERVTAEKRKDLLQRALRSGDAILKLFSNVLDADVLKPDTIRFKPVIVPLMAFLREVVATFDPRAIGEPGMEAVSFAERDVTLTIPTDLAIFADGARMQQILTNLLSNALKYSPSGSPIHITAQREAPARAQAPTGMVRISIRDHGLGVPPQKAAQLFQRFVRLERDIASTVRGTGVGLFLCRQLVEAMGGRIWVESSGVEGEGATFAFTLPETPAMQGTAVTPGRVQVGQPAKRFAAADLAGRPIALEDYYGQKILLAFLRSATCPLCNARLWYLTQRYSRLKAQGLEVIAILESTPEVTREYTMRIAPPFPIIPDNSKALFQLYGVRSSRAGIRGMLRLSDYLFAWMHGHHRLVSDGDLAQLPADILIGPDLVVRKTHYGKDIGDYLPLRDVERFASEA